MTALTLIDGDAQQVYEAHPIEVARRALMAAAEVEEGSLLASQLRRFALLLPRRQPSPREADSRGGE